MNGKLILTFCIFTAPLQLMAEESCVTDQARKDFRTEYRLDQAEQMLTDFYSQVRSDETEYLKEEVEKVRRLSISLADEMTNTEFRQMGVNAGRWNDSLMVGFKTKVEEMVSRYWDNFEGTVYRGFESLLDVEKNLITLAKDPWSYNYRAPVVAIVGSKESFLGEMKKNQVRNIHIERDSETGKFGYTILVAKKDGNINNSDWFDDQVFFKSVDKYLQSQCK